MSVEYGYKINPYWDSFCYVYKEHKIVKNTAYRDHKSPKRIMQKFMYSRFYTF